MRRFTNKGFLVFLMLISSFTLFADGPPVVGGYGEEEKNLAPIDTHLFLLLILALLYGLYKVYLHKHNKKTPN